MIYLVVAVIILHISVVPIVAGGSVYVDTDGKRGELTARLYALPVFRKRFDTDRLLGIIHANEANSGEHEGGAKKKHSGAKKAVRAYLLRAGLAAAKRVRVRDMSVDAELGAGDAAATAFITGAARIMYAQGCALLSREQTGNISPFYDYERVFIDFYGIFSLCFADIIIAAAQALRK